MRLRIRVSLGLVLLIAVTALPADAASVSELGWLAGCWAREDAEPGSGEHWMPPAGGTLLGLSRTVKAGKTVEYEFIVIRETAPGQLAYIAHPSGQSPATFPLLRLSEGEAVFENLEHDFPQRVIYRLEKEGRLKARIEGLRKGEVRGVDFPMRRVGCE